MNGKVHVFVLNYCLVEKCVSVMNLSYMGLDASIVDFLGTRMKILSSSASSIGPGQTAQTHWPAGGRGGTLLVAQPFSNYSHYPRGKLPCLNKS